jgi:hypothetical protein
LAALADYLLIKGWIILPAFHICFTSDVHTDGCLVLDDAVLHLVEALFLLLRETGSALVNPVLHHTLRGWRADEGAGLALAVWWIPLEILADAHLPAVRQDSAVHFALLAGRHALGTAGRLAVGRRPAGTVTDADAVVLVGDRMGNAAATQFRTLCHGLLAVGVVDGPVVADASFCSRLRIQRTAAHIRKAIHLAVTIGIFTFRHRDFFILADAPGFIIGSHDTFAAETGFCIAAATLGIGG